MLWGPCWPEGPGEQEEAGGARRSAESRGRMRRPQDLHSECGSFWNCGRLGGGPKGWPWPAGHARSVLSAETG
eukprot:9467462-Pyramimonas_sp.AAC.1